ncbi:hypothetical protein ACOSQ2_021216 [Xanthoceras sorbifolium]
MYQPLQQPFSPSPPIIQLVFNEDTNIDGEEFGQWDSNDEDEISIPYYNPYVEHGFDDFDDPNENYTDFAQANNNHEDIHEGCSREGFMDNDPRGDGLSECDGFSLANGGAGGSGFQGGSFGGMGLGGGEVGGGGLCEDICIFSYRHKITN